MSGNLRIFILICGICFCITIIKLLINRKFSERESIIWLLGAIGGLIVSVFPKILDVLAKVIGVDYPPSILFLGCTVTLFLICLYCSIQIANLNAQVRELTQSVAIRNIEYPECLNCKIRYKEVELLESCLVKEGNAENENVR